MLCIDSEFMNAAALYAKSRIAQIGNEENTRPHVIAVPMDAQSLIHSGAVQQVPDPNNPGNMILIIPF